MPINIETLLTSYCFVVLALLLWPFGFVLPCHSCTNGAAWIMAKSRVEFRSPGLVRSISAPIGLYERLLSGKGLTIELWLKTGNLHQVGPARIVSYSKSPLLRNFTLAQQGSNLVFRLRTTKTDLNGTNPELVVSGVFLPERRQHIVVSYDGSSCHIFVDGRSRESGRFPGGTFSNWDPNHLLLLGNEQTGDRPWNGSIDRVFLYDRPVSKSEVLESYQSGGSALAGSGIVGAFNFAKGAGNLIYDLSKIESKTFLEVPSVFTNKETPDFLTVKRRRTSDWLSNAIVFFPFGFLLLLYLSSKSLGIFTALMATFLATVLFSLLAESLQYYVEARTSSLFDAISSLAGSLFGSLIAVPFRI